MGLCLRAPHHCHCSAGIERRRRDAGGKLRLDTVKTIGKGLERKIGLRPRKTGERDLEHQARVGSRAHLERCVIEHGQGARQAVRPLKERRLV